MPYCAPSVNGAQCQAYSCVPSLRGSGSPAQPGTSSLVRRGFNPGFTSRYLTSCIADIRIKFCESDFTSRVSPVSPTSPKPTLMAPPFWSVRPQWALGRCCEVVCLRSREDFASVANVGQAAHFAGRLQGLGPRLLRPNYRRNLRATKWGKRSGCMAAILSHRCPLCAKADILRCGKKCRYSITSSAVASSAGGTVTPSVFALPLCATSEHP